MENGIRVSIIVAVDRENVIGNSKAKGGLPWPRHKADMRHFVEKTMGKPVIMGRVSYEFVEPKYRPFKDRPTIVVSRSADFSGEGAIMARSVKESIAMAKNIARDTGVDEVFVAGGEQIYREALAFHLVDRIYLTRIDGKFEGNAFFPRISELGECWKGNRDELIREADAENPRRLIFMTLDRKPH